MPSPILHVVPVQPCLHSQENLLVPSIHLPSFLHGFDAHSLTLTSGTGHIERLIDIVGNLSLSSD